MLPEIYRWNADPKSLVLFTFQPDFSELVVNGKQPRNWSTKNQNVCIFFQLPLISQSLKTFLTISKNCQANVLSTPLLKTECYKHTFCESFGLCFKFVLVSSLFFTKLSGVQSTNDGGLLGRAIVALRTTSNKFSQKCQSEMRQKSQFNLLRLNFNSFNFMTFMTFKS